MKTTPLKKYIKTCDEALCRRRAWWRVDTGDAVFFLCNLHIQGGGKGSQLNGPQPDNLTLPLRVATSRKETHERT